MTLVLNNEDVASVITMDATIAALEEAYADLAANRAVCRPRIDISIPTGDPDRTYRWGTMEGGSVSGYFAIRMKSDIMYEQTYAGVTTIEKYCVRPGTFCGLVMLFDVRSGEPLAFLNDGCLQHYRVGADSAIGAKHMARQDAAVVGMIGSGGMARSHIEAFLRVRDIKRIQVYSPTPGHRQAYAEETAARYGIEAVAFDDPENACRGADIVAGCTDAKGYAVLGEWLEPGTHLTCIGGKPDPAALERIDVALRLGNATAPAGRPEFAVEDEYLTYAAMDDEATGGKRARGAVAGDRSLLLGELLAGRAAGRTADDQITFSERGNIQGAQFFAVAGMVYELAKDKGLGREIPTDGLLQNIRN